MKFIGSFSEDEDAIWVRVAKRVIAVQQPAVSREIF